MGVVIAKITTAFGGVLVAVKSAILGFAPLLAGAAIPAAIIGLGVLIFKFRDQIGDSLKAVGQFFVNAFSPLTNFIGNVFNGAMDLARNAFNRLPNIVQEAIKFATAPLRSFVNLLKNILSMLGIVRDGTSNLQKPPSTIPPSDITTTSIPQTSNFDSTIFTAPTTSTFTSNPATSGLSSSNFNSSDSYQTGLTTTGSTNASDDFNNQSSATTLTATELPNGTFLIEQKPKPPNITIETGNVVQIDNTNYVTTDDLVNAVSNATTQTLNYIQAGGVKYYL